MSVSSCLRSCMVPSTLPTNLSSVDEYLCPCALRTVEEAPFQVWVPRKWERRRGACENGRSLYLSDIWGRAGATRCPQGTDQRFKLTFRPTSSGGQETRADVLSLYTTQEALIFNLMGSSCA